MTSVEWPDTETRIRHRASDGFVFRRNLKPRATPRCQVSGEDEQEQTELTEKRFSVSSITSCQEVTSGKGTSTEWRASRGREQQSSFSSL